MSLRSSQLGILGWNQFSSVQVQATTTSDGKIRITNAAALFALLPEQKTGTALYGANSSNTPVGELAERPYDLSIQDLLPQQFTGTLEFIPQPDGTYKLDGNGSLTLTQVSNQFRLQQKDGTVMVFRADGQVESVQNANGYRLTVNYDGNGRLTGLNTTSGDSFTFSYNAQGRVERLTDQTGQQMQFTYDNSGHLLTRIQESTGRSVSFTYGNAYNPFVVTSVTDSNGMRVTYDYDGSGRLQRQQIGDGQQQLTYRYDAQGNLTITDATGAQTQVAYLSGGKVVQVTDPVGRVTQYTYDANGLLDKVTGALGFQLDYNFCGCGELRSMVDALGNTTRFTYAANGKLASIIDARNNPLSFEYDTGGNLTTITYADGSQQRYAYSASGLLTSETNRRGQSQTYSYDSSYRLTQERFADNSTLTYGYSTTTGLLNSITDSRGTTTIDYNQSTNQLAINYGGGRSLTYRFDNMGRRTQLMTQDGAGSRTVNYSYTNLGQLDRLTDGVGNLIVDYDYDSRTGQLQRETNGNGSYTTYSYNSAGELTSVVNHAADGIVNSRFDYTYDALGRRSEMTTLEGTWTYTYDMNGQLTRGVFSSNDTAVAPHQDLSYEYDAAGNRIRTIENGVTQDYATNNLNQYTTSDSTTYSYDADGNLISKTAGGQTWTYSYDQQNRLVQVVDQGNNITQYEYDVFGNRSATIYNGQRTSYLIDPFGMGDVLAEYDHSGNQVAQYTHGIGLVNRVSGSSTAYYDFDALGSTVGLTGTGGSVLNRYRYNPFGEDIFESETVANPFEYVGQWGVTEEVNGLDFMRARFYDSRLGRFVSMDPIGLQGRDTNIYRYTFNNPVSLVDPEGTAAPILGLSLASGGISFALSWIANCAGYGPLSSLGLVAAAGGIRSILGGGGIANPATAILSGVAGGALLGDVVARWSGCDGGSAQAAPPPSGPGSNHWTGGVRDEFLRAGQALNPLIDPLILDLDGDGLELTSLSDQLVRFDLDMDGMQEATGWVKADDGLLVLDRNNDTIINDYSELFGARFMPDSGFDRLRELDSNGDNWISAADTDFSKLQVWRDFDQDGFSDYGELFSLTQLNISRIGVNFARGSQIVAGNTLTDFSTYELANGTQRQIIGLWFAVDQMNSRYDFRSTANSSLTITNEILNLPTLQGYGNLPDLTIAMSRDSQLLNLVRTFTQQVQQGNYAGVESAIENILFRWAGVTILVNDGSFDNRKLFLIESLMGASLGRVSINPTSEAGYALTRAYSILFNALSSRLIAQTLTGSVSYDVESDLLKYRNLTGQPAISNVYEQRLVEQFFVEENGTGTANYIVNFAGRVDNTITTGNGNDSINVGLGRDRVIGGAGDDLLILDYSSLTYTGTSPGAGISSLVSSGSGGSEGYYRAYNSPSDFDRIDFFGIERFQITGTIARDTIQAGNGNDLVSSGDGDDTIFTRSGDDTIDAGSGNDVIDAGSGNDSINAGDGDDFIVAGTGIKAIDGGAGIDTLSNGNFSSATVGLTFNGSNTVIALPDGTTVRNIERFINLTTGSGDDVIRLDGQLQSGYEQNTINSGSGNDSIITGVASDNISAGDGNDTVSSGAGNDIISGGTGVNVIDGGDGIDTLTDSDFGSATVGLTINNVNTVITLADGTSIRNIERFTNLTTGSGNDTIILTDQHSATVVNAGNGNDTIATGNGNNTINAGVGDDIISSGTGTNIIDGGDGIDTLANGDFSWTGTGLTINNTNTVISLSDGTSIRNIERFASLTTGSGNDVINFTVRDNNILNTGSGDDTINANLGKDSIDGGSGNDLLTLNYSSLTYTGTSPSAGITSAVSSNGAGGFNGFYNAYSSSSDFERVDFSNIERFQITGTVANDSITTGNGNDTLNGGAGNDTLDGQGGNDTLNGGTGNDTLIGGTGNDSYSIDSTGDVIQETSTTATEIDSVTSTVTYTLGSNLENLTLSGSSIINGTGNSLANQITGNGAVNQLEGGAGNDVLRGGNGDDTLGGGDGNDQLFGESGVDLLTGSLGDDTLSGGASNDTLTGGEGIDYFLYDTNAVFNTSAIGIDRITDFVLNTDKIVLDKTTFTALNSVAGSGFSVAGEFASVADDTAAATSSASIVYSRATGNLFYNQNGAASGLGTGAQFATLSGLPNITASDILIRA